MLKYLLDTNIVIYVMKRKPLEVLKIFNKNANRMAISTITLAELMYGAEKSQQVESNLNNIEDFVSHLEVLPYDINATQHYGQIKAFLESKGKPIGVNDIHKVRNGSGLLVLSTPKGILSGRDARKEQVGGEALFMIW